MKKVFVVLFVFMLLFLSGCNRKDENTPLLSDKRLAELSIKGRYIEQEIQLPEEFDKYTSLQLTKKDDMPFIYAFSYKGSISGYRMNNDEIWAEDTPEWLRTVSLPEGEFYEPEVFEDEQGKQYLFYLTIDENIYKANLLSSADGSGYEEVFPEGWNEKEGDSMFQNVPRKMAALENGTLVALFYPGDVNLYDKNNYKILKSISGDNYTEFILSTKEETIILGKTNDSGILMGIDIYNTSDYSKLTYPYQSEFSQNTETYFDMNDKKEMALCDQAGIHVLEEGTSTWQTIVDGDLTSLTMKTMHTVGFVSASDSNYYILYITQNGYSFMKYSYDEATNAVPSSQLNIYSIKDNPTLRQAAALFRQTHPDIKINFNIIMTDEEYLEADQAIINDYVRALNTELLAGNGPDILVLDDLPVDSYIAKGHLVDISEIIQPMIDKDELYLDIMSNYKIDEKIYYLPTRFIPNLLCTRASDADKLSSLEELSEYLGKMQDRTLFGKMTYEDFINEFAPYITNKILDEDGAISKSKLIDQLELLKSIGDSIGLVDQYIGDEKYINNEINIANEIELAFSHPMGFNHAMIPIGMVDLVKGSYTVFENSFIPVCELAVNQASKSKDLSKEFISLVISEEVQKEDFLDGFPVNKKAIELCIQKEAGDYGFAVGVRREDGSEDIHYFEPINKQKKKELADKYAGISNRIVRKEPFLIFLKDELREFLNDNLSVEDTAVRIIDRTNIYLSE